MLAIYPPPTCEQVRSSTLDRFPASASRCAVVPGAEGPRLIAAEGALCEADRRRAARLLAVRIEYIESDEFRLPEADRLMREDVLHDNSSVSLPVAGPLGDDVGSTSNSEKPGRLPAYIDSLYDVALLEPAEEYALFRRFNYVKFKAARLQKRLRRREPTVAELDRLERRLREAERLKSRLIRANLRLVVSLAKRFSDENNTFDDLVSDGNLSLMRAVEKYNYALGHRFSTYATHAIRRGYFRTIARARQLRSRFVADDEMLRSAAADLPESQLSERQIVGLRASFQSMLAKLDQREQQVVRQRFGLDQAAPKTFKELGETMGVCKERVRQIQARAMAKLRTMADEARLERMIDDVA